ACAEMFWITATSAALACFPEARVLTSVAMLSAICVSTGRSWTATLIHCGVQPTVAVIKAITKASRDFSLERMFIVAPFVCGIEADGWVLRQRRYLATSELQLN